MELNQNEQNWRNDQLWWYLTSIPKNKVSWLTLTHFRCPVLVFHKCMVNNGFLPIWNSKQQENEHQIIRRDILNKPPATRIWPGLFISKSSLSGYIFFLQTTLFFFNQMKKKYRHVNRSLNASQLGHQFLQLLAHTC